MYARVQRPQARAPTDAVGGMSRLSMKNRKLPDWPGRALWWSVVAWAGMSLGAITQCATAPRAARYEPPTRTEHVEASSLLQESAEGSF
jgi:hypothetical protein